MSNYDQAWNDAIDRTIEIVSSFNGDLRSHDKKEELKELIKKEMRL